MPQVIPIILETAAFVGGTVYQGVESAKSGTAAEKAKKDQDARNAELALAPDINDGVKDGVALSGAALAQVRGQGGSSREGAVPQKSLLGGDEVNAHG